MIFLLNIVITFPNMLVFRSFFDIKSVSDIRLPSLNILPKLNKLIHKASPGNQHLLKSRPILNGFNAFITQPSKLLSKIFPR